ncbi:hypothetical protein T439DRAFT_365670 [Meredithblackwellia eburnea MCA 4105]
MFQIYVQSEELTGYPDRRPVGTDRPHGDHHEDIHGIKKEEEKKRVMRPTTVPSPLILWTALERERPHFNPKKVANELDRWETGHALRQRTKAGEPSFSSHDLKTQHLDLLKRQHDWDNIYDPPVNLQHYLYSKPGILSKYTDAQWASMQAKDFYRLVVEKFSLEHQQDHLRSEAFHQRVISFVNRITNCEKVLQLKIKGQNTSSTVPGPLHDARLAACSDATRCKQALKSWITNADPNGKIEEPSGIPDRFHLSPDVLIPHFDFQHYTAINASPDRFLLKHVLSSNFITNHEREEVNKLEGERASIIGVIGSGRPLNPDQLVTLYKTLREHDREITNWLETLVGRHIHVPQPRRNPATTAHHSHADSSSGTRLEDGGHDELGKKLDLGDAFAHVDWLVEEVWKFKKEVIEILNSKDRKEGFDEMISDFGSLRDLVRVPAIPDEKLGAEDPKIQKRSKLDSGEEVFDCHIGLALGALFWQANVGRAVWSKANDAATVIRHYMPILDQEETTMFSDEELDKADNLVSRACVELAELLKFAKLDDEDDALAYLDYLVLSVWKFKAEFTLENPHDMVGIFSSYKQLEALVYTPLERDTIESLGPKDGSFQRDSTDPQEPEDAQECFVGRALGVLFWRAGADKETWREANTAAQVINENKAIVEGEQRVSYEENKRVTNSVVGACKELGRLLELVKPEHRKRMRIGH